MCVSLEGYGLVLLLTIFVLEQNIKKANVVDRAKPKRIGSVLFLSSLAGNANIAEQCRHNNYR